MSLADDLEPFAAQPFSLAAPSAQSAGRPSAALPLKSGLMPQEAGCIWDSVPASKACARPTPAYPRDAVAINVPNSCERHKLEIAYIRAWRMSVYAWRYLEMIGTCPSTKIRNHLWSNPHLTSAVTSGTHPAMWFGAINVNFLNRMRAVTHALMSRFLNGVKKWNGYHAVEFRYVPYAEKFCNTRTCGWGGLATCHPTLGVIELCESLFEWNEEDQDMGQVPSRTWLAMMIVHEMMHRLYPSQLQPDLQDQIIPGFGTHATPGIAWYLVDPLIVNPPRPDLATLNIDSYTGWFRRLYSSVEQHCRLFNNPVGFDGKTPYYYVNGKWQTSAP